MTENSDERAGHFYIGLDDDVFSAYVPSELRNNSWMRAEQSASLSDLLEKCRQRGLTTFDGLTEEAASEIHRWLTVTQPALKYVEGFWNGDTTSQSDRGPIGFPIPAPDCD